MIGGFGMSGPFVYSMSNDPVADQVSSSVNSGSSPLEMLNVPDRLLKRLSSSENVTLSVKVEKPGPSTSVATS